MALAVSPRGLAAALALLVALAAPTEVLSEAPRSLAGVSVTTVDGESLRGEEYEGSFVLVDFWATWCAPCLEDLPHLRRLVREFGGQGFEVLGVSMDEMGRPGFRSWLLRQRIDWRQVHDGRSFDGALARQFEVDAVPATFLYDRRGRLLGRDVGLEEVEAILQAALRSTRRGR